MNRASFFSSLSAESTNGQVPAQWILASAKHCKPWTASRNPKDCTYRVNYILFYISHYLSIYIYIYTYIHTYIHT